VDEVPLVVVDAANVVGSVPDGWWRDRRAATERLLDRLELVLTEGLVGGPEPPFDLVAVVEGAARTVGARDGVSVVPADGSGDDAIVEVVRAAGADRARLVVTADRGLRDRVEALGATVVGPRAVRRTR
jgi:hypothetical protein